jgi:hypothetical protein
MKNLPQTWITIKYQDDLFDVHLTQNQTIDEIRTVDSEINILSILDSNTVSSIQNLIKEISHAI